MKVTRTLLADVPDALASICKAMGFVRADIWRRFGALGTVGKSAGDIRAAITSTACYSGLPVATRRPEAACTSVCARQASRNEEYAYTEVIDEMRSRCLNFGADARQLWRRLVFDHLITNVDDHLHNIGFLYVDKNLWRLSPAFDVNPFPDKDRESKTWLSEDTGPITSIQQLLEQATRCSRTG